MDPTQNPVNPGVPVVDPNAGVTIPPVPVTPPVDQPAVTPEPQAPEEQPVVPPVVPGEGTGDAGTGGMPPTSTPPAAV